MRGDQLQRDQHDVADFAQLLSQERGDDGGANESRLVTTLYTQVRHRGALSVDRFDQLYRRQSRRRVLELKPGSVQSTLSGAHDHVGRLSAAVGINVVRLLSRGIQYGAATDHDARAYDEGDVVCSVEFLLVRRFYHRTLSAGHCNIPSRMRMHRHRDTLYGRHSDGQRLRHHRRQLNHQ